MAIFDSKLYRDNLAKQIKSVPKKERKTLWEQSSQTPQFIEAYLEYVRPRWREKDLFEKQRTEARKPDITFNLDDEEDFEKSILILAQYIYSTITIYNKDGGYDPYKGHMSCGEITDKFIKYLKNKNIRVRRVTRGYEVRCPDGSYDNNFGHVYLIIDNDQAKEKILVDATYLQWVLSVERKSLPPVLIIRYKNSQDFKEKISRIPIKNGMVLAFYLGFDSPEVQEFFKDDKFTILSEEVACID